MKILSLYRTYYPDPPGGLQEAIRQICTETSRLGIENTIFTLSPNNKVNEIKSPEATVVRDRSWIAPASCDIGGYSSFTKFSELIKQADCLHYHFPWPFADVMHLACSPKIPALITYHSDIVRQKKLASIYSPLMWKTLSSMKLIVATSPAYYQTSSVLSDPAIREKVRIIPLGIDELTYPKEYDDSIFERLNLIKAESYFLFLGVLRYYKGIHTLINAAKNLDSKVVVAGSGPQAELLKRQVSELGLKNIVFAGQVTNQEKVALIRNCLALVLPSHLRSEAFGMVLVEAAMMGKPMISCEIGTGTSYVNLDKTTGIVVQPENIDEMSDAMNTILKDSGLASKFGSNARLRYEQLFSGPALGKAYKSLYDEMLK